jgi:hypothetical protein
MPYSASEVCDGIFGDILPQLVNIEDAGPVLASQRCVNCRCNEYPNMLFAFPRLFQSGLSVPLPMALCGDLTRTMMLLTGVHLRRSRKTGQVPRNTHHRHQKLLGRSKQLSQLAQYCHPAFEPPVNSLTGRSVRPFIIVAVYRITGRNAREAEVSVLTSPREIDGEQTGRVTPV